MVSFQQVAKVKPGRTTTDDGNFHKITEIDLTSPTCVREIEGHYNISIMAMLFDAIEKRLASN